MGNAVALQRGQRKAFGRLPGVSRPKDVEMLRAHRTTAESAPTKAQDRDSTKQAEQYIRQGCRYVIYCRCCGLQGGLLVIVVDGPRFPTF